MSRRGWVLFATMCVIWGVPYLLIKVAVSDLSPVTLVFFRTGIAALILVPLAAVRGSLSPLIRHWKAVLAYTVIEVAVPWLLLAHAELRLSSSLTGLLIAATPFVGVILGLITGADEQFGARRLAGLAVGFLGVATLVGFSVSSTDLLAAGEVVLVAVCYATGPLIVSRRLSGVPGIGVAAISLALPAIVLAPFGLAQAPPEIPPIQVIAAVGILAVVCTAIGFVVFFALIADVGPVRATVITYVNPAVALALGIALLGEPFTVGTAVGFALILIGLLLASRRNAQLEGAAVNGRMNTWSTRADKKRWRDRVS
jgi:drug/metabolite transporter (DMT)-like permease